MRRMAHQGHPPHHSHARDSHTHDFDWAAMVTLTEREAEVLGGFLAEATSSLADLAADYGLEVRRIIDVGCGPGVGTCALAQRFPEATVVAADGSAEMLESASARAARLGLAERVETTLIDLPDGIATLGPADLVWASMVLHHVGDEAGALRGLRARLQPGGLLALVELGDPMRVVPDDVDLDRPGLWARLDDANAAWLRDLRMGLSGSVPSADYVAMLRDAGFEVVTDRMLTVRLDPPLDDRARQVALTHAQRLREHVAPYADPADVDALGILADPDGPSSVGRCPDAFLHASRRLLVSRAVP